MRVLFTFIGGWGHFHPLVPVARAAAASGHEVAIACSGRLVGQVESAGFTAFATSPLRAHDAGSPSRDLTPLAKVDPPRNMQPGMVAPSSRPGQQSPLC